MSARALLLSLLLLAAAPAAAVQPDEMLADPAAEARARAISKELRCLVCRNENIDDSNAGLARDLRLLVTTDTGPRHYATAFRVPAVVIMGPTHPGWTASCLDHQEIVRRDVPCGPCQLPICPLDHACMTGISPADVLERVEALERRTSPLRAAG